VGLKALFRGLSANDILLRCEFRRIRSVPEGAVAVMAFLAENGHLKELVFSDCEFDPGRGCSSLGVSLGMGLARNDSLAVLSVQNCSFSEPAVGRALADGLRVNSSLNELSLVSCGLDRKAVEALAASLQFNSFLLALNLSGNDMGQAGAFALANLIGVNFTLQVLELDATGIGDDGAMALAEALLANEHHTGIRRLTIALNGLSVAKGFIDSSQIGKVYQISH
jgi:hypothetical protein